MRNIKTVFLALFLVFAIQVNSAEKDDLNSKTEENIKELAIGATELAHSKLAVNSKDKKGQTLLKFADHIYPKYRPLILLRAQIKYNIKINKPKEDKTEKEFVSLLKRAISALPSKGNDKLRHLSSLYYSVLRIFEPENEDALVMLMVYEDMGYEVNLDKLFRRNFREYRNIVRDPKDSRYIISDITKSMYIPADTPWTDTWIKVKAGTQIHISASGLWTFGEGPFPAVGANGYSNLEMTKIFKAGVVKKKTKTARIVKRKFKGELEPNLGCLVAKIGKKIYPIGEEITFRAEKNDILYLGPYEWDDYSDNSGRLLVTIEVSY
jgi:hypothetical protein